MLGHLGAAWKHLYNSPCALEALTSPSRPAFSTPYLQNHTKNGLLVWAGSQSYTSSLSCTTNTIRQSSSNGFVAAFQTPPISAAVETTPGYRSNYSIILSVEARSPSSISTNNSHNDAEVCATLNQMLANEKRRPSTFGANLLPICKTIQLMVANGKQEIVHFSGRCTKHLTIQCTTEIRSPMLHPNTTHYRIATSCTSHVRTHCH